MTDERDTKEARGTAAAAATRDDEDRETAAKAAREAATEETKAMSREALLERVVQLGFGGDRERFERFLAALRQAIPPDVTIILRGSAVTGIRWADSQPFDADGPGTSDLDLTLVGGEMIALWKLPAMYIPGLHTAPLDDRIPDAAPALVPLRRALCTLAGRPVNIQATTNLVQYARDVLFDQPWVTLIDKEERAHEQAEWDREIARKKAELDARDGRDGEDEDA